MKGQKIQSAQISRYILEVVKNRHPETVERLVMLVQQKYCMSEQEIMDIACSPALDFKNQSTSVSLDLKHYMTSARARWYWLTITLCMLTAIVVSILPEIHPVIYVRYLLGSVLVLWMPGYCLVKSLFPGKKLEKLELIALSLGTGVVLVPMMAFVLHYTPWGIKTASVISVLLILTLALSTLAIVREHRDLWKH